jgi:hypothetical protein
MPDRHLPFLIAPVVLGAIVAAVTAPAVVPERDQPGHLEHLHVQETVEAVLAEDGQIRDARLRTHTTATGGGRVEILDPTVTEGLREPGRLRRPPVEEGRSAWRPDLDGTHRRETLARLEPADVPLVVRVRYELDGAPVSAEELRGATGEAVVRVQLRNPTAEPHTVEVDADGRTLRQDVGVSLPLLTEARVELDDSWRDVTTDHGRSGADAAGVTSVVWSSALFTPFGSDTAELEIRGRVDGAAPPSLRVEATPVTSDTSDLLALVADRAGDEGVADAVAAFLAAAVADGLTGAAEGAGALGDGLARLRDELGQAGAGLDDLADVDPDALAADALDDLAGALDPDALLADLLDPAAMPDLDLASALDALDPAALLADADLEGILDAVLADLAGDLDLDGLEIDPDLLEQALRDRLADVDLGLGLADLLARIGLGDVADGDLPDTLLELDLAEALATWLEDLDPAELVERLEGSDLDDALQDLDLAALLAEQLGERTLGDLLGEVELPGLFDLLAEFDGLELALAAVLTPLLDELDLAVPGRSAAELEAVADGLRDAIGALAALSDALATSPDADSATAAGSPSTQELIGVADRLSGLLGDAARTLHDHDLAVLDDVERHLAVAAVGLDDAHRVVDAMAGDTDDGAAGRAQRLGRALAEIDAAVDAATEHTGAARGELEQRLGGIGDDLASAAGEVDRVRAALTGQDGTAGPDGTAADADTTDLTETLAALRHDLGGLLTTVDAVGDDLAGLGDLEELLLAGAADVGAPAEELLPEDLGERLAALPLASLLEEVRLADLLAGLDLELDAGQLLGQLDPDGLVTWLRGQQLTVAELLEALGVDPAEAFAGLDLPELADLLDELDLDLDLDALLADLGLDPADLAPDLDLERLLADVVWPELADALGDADLDALLAELLPDPAELFAGLPLPDLESLLGGLDLDALLGQLGLDALGDLDLLVDGLLAGLGELLSGTGELADALRRLLDEGVDRLSDQLDDEALEARRDLALVAALEARAEEAQPTPPPAGAEASASYVLTMRPSDPDRGPLAAALGLLGMAGGLELLRRRTTGG